MSADGPHEFPRLFTNKQLADALRRMAQVRGVVQPVSADLKLHLYEAADVFDGLAQGRLIPEGNPRPDPYGPRPKGTPRRR